ncbi:MAG: hypothetical protein CVT47_04265, partial [Thermoplasmata archaeon HGW-Thermoplasmata-2]
VVIGSYVLDNAHASKTIDLLNCWPALASGNHTIKMTQSGTGFVMVSVKTKQVVPEDEAYANASIIPWIDPISANFSIAIGLPAEAQQNESFQVNVTAQNKIAVPLNSPIITIQLPSGVELVNQGITITLPIPTLAPDRYGFVLNGTPAIYGEYNTTTKVVYLFPNGIPAFNGTPGSGSSTFRFNVTSSQLGAKTLFGNIRPMYNPTYMNITDATVQIVGLAKVTGLIATAGDGRVSLSWSAPENGGSNITGYKIYWGTSSPPTTVITLTGTATTYTHTGRTNGVPYYYQVSAVNGVGEGTKSVETSATPQGLPVPPAKVTGLTATAGDGQVSLSWTANSVGDAVTNYYVYRGTTAGGTKTKIAEPTTTS